MKKVLLFALLIGCLSGMAQDEGYAPKTLLGGKDKSVRGYFALNEKGLILNNQVALLSGAELNLVFGHRITIGFFGFGKTNRVQSDFVDVQGFRHYYELGMGGIKLERTFFTNSVIHFTVPVNVGVGGMSLSRRSIYDYEMYDNPDNWGNALYDFDTFVFIEPGVNLELNLFKHLRLAGGVGYFFTDEMRLAGTGAKPLNNFTGNVSLRLGWF